MKIFFDTGAGEEELNFTLEGSLPFVEILKKLSAWAESQKVFIIDYHVAAKPQYKEKESLNSDEIETIHLRMGDQASLIESNLRELIDYTDRAGLHLAKSIQDARELSENEKADLLSGSSFIAESLETLSRHLVPESIEYMEKAVNALLNNNDLVEKINALGAVQYQLKLWLREREFSRVQPEEAKERIARFREQIPEIKKDLEKVAAYFTQGKEHDALTKLELVSQTLVDAAMLMRIAKDVKAEVVQKIVSLLGDLTQAVTARDLVTAADIADFDLRDALEEIA
ncbi:MAG: hypothetical protein LDLANPLL_00114 [Turneriella sp.]|nr:hypothetical protein [Turneriella sp.]